MEKNLRVALVHDYLVQDGGAERVLAAMQEMFPHAPTFTLLYDKKRAHPQFQQRNIKTSPLARFPFANRHSEWYVTLMPTMTEYLDISGYDLVLSSSIAFAKGIILPPETKHVCYCHTPTRFLWQDRIGYLNDLQHPRVLRSILPHILHGMRTWDRIAAERPTHFLTNSFTSRSRIQRYYSRDAEVIYPPVDVDRIRPNNKPGTFWLAGGRLVGYKRFDLIVTAFAKLDLPLKIFGVGPEMRKLRKLAGPKTELLGRVTDQEKINLYQNAIGFIHPQLEDFGIAAVEAMAAGRPVIAYGKGGAAETVIPGITGEHIDAQTWVDIGDAVIRFRPEKYDKNVIRRHAETFSTQRFQTQLRAYIDRTLATA